MKKHIPFSYLKPYLGRKGGIVHIGGFQFEFFFKAGQGNEDGKLL